MNKHTSKRLVKLQYRAQVLSSFGFRLRNLRLEKGLTPSQFEAVSGIDAGNLAKYEEGFREPGIIIVLIMAKTLGISHLELLDFTVALEL